ncbi:MAG: hypothetical protein ACRDH2_10645 [Anaerolineales bacterium]
MSKVKKSKRARRPNVPMATGPVVAPTLEPSRAVGGRLEAAGDANAQPRGRGTEPAPVKFDYTHIKKDLTRIGVLAGSFIAVLVILSFIIK